MDKRVAVTGLGAVTPIGNTAQDTWESLKAGRSGVGKITTFDAETFPVQIAGMVKDFTPPKGRHLSRAAGFGVAAALEAIADSGFEGAYESHEIGVGVAGSVGRADLQELVDMSWTIQESGGKAFPHHRPSDVLERDQNVFAATIGNLANAEGPMFAVSTACTASLHALGEAFRRVQEGDVKVMISGGTDALTTWFDVIGFGLLGALTKDHQDEPERASRPFDKERGGFVLGEGAVMLILEELESAQARGAKIYGEIVGYGSSMNAYRMTDPPPDGGGVTLAIEMAINDAGLSPTDIQYVSAHGTSHAGQRQDRDAGDQAGVRRACGHARDLAR